MKLDKYNRNTMDAILNNIGYVKNHNGLGYHKKCFTGVAFIRIARGMYGSNYYSWLFSSNTQNQTTLNGRRIAID